MSIITFGYDKIGDCIRCRQADHLFVSSREDSSARCVDCWGSLFYGESVRIPNTLEFPILEDASFDRCQACGGLEVENTHSYKFVQAFLADGETEVTVHARCTSSHECVVCENDYAITLNRQWRTTVPLPVELPDRSLFTGFIKIDGEDYCSSCTTSHMDSHGGSDNFFECGSCDETYHINNGGYYMEWHYCDGCLDSNVYECNECETQQWDGNGHDCQDFEEDDGDGSGVIHNHTYRPTPQFFGDAVYHFGFELEIESMGNGRHEGAELVQDTLGAHAYLKEDGSLNDGFEIVTHPHTLDSYQSNFDWSILDTLKRRGYRSWNTQTCGLHVHVSRTAFGNQTPRPLSDAPHFTRSQRILQKQAHELRFMKLIYDNQRQVERIAGRSESRRFASFEDKGNLVRKVKNGSQSNGRYSAINTDNDDTIEVRVFKGSLRKERVLSAVEFVQASVEYTRDMKVTSKNHALSWLKFTGYVAANAEMYPNLVTIMSESFAGDDNPNENNN